MTTAPFSLQSRREGDVLVIEAAGEIDMGTAPELASAILAVPAGARRVVVHLGEVSFLDSSALNALVRCQRELASRDVGFRVVIPADRVVRSVFEITRLTEPLSVVESLDDALL